MSKRWVSRVIVIFSTQEETLIFDMAMSKKELARAERAQDQYLNGGANKDAEWLYSLLFDEHGSQLMGPTDGVITLDGPATIISFGALL